MEREIKFRGKSSIKNQWAYGSLISIGDGYIIAKSNNIVGETISQDIALSYSSDEIDVVYPDTVGQYTGLQDKNGKDIYEGDIIQLQAKESKFNCLVGWNSELGAWCISIEDKHVGIKPLGEWLCEDKFEVIGNIYDSKDLLED